MQVKYIAIIEECENGGFSAYCPDVPGCVSTGDSLHELIDSFQEALEFHFNGLIEDGLDIPSRSATAAEPGQPFFEVSVNVKAAKAG